MVNKRKKNLLYNFYFRQTAILILYFFNFNPLLLLFSSFFPTFFVLILSYLSRTCTFFFADISGRAELSLLFWTFLSETYFPGGGGGGARTPSALPPPPAAYAPAFLCSYMPKTLAFSSPRSFVHNFYETSLVMYVCRKDGDRNR